MKCCPLSLVYVEASRRSETDRGSFSRASAPAAIVGRSKSWKVTAAPPMKALNIQGAKQKYASFCYKRYD